MVASGVLLINEDREIGKKQGCINNGCKLEKKKREAGGAVTFFFKEQNKIKSVKGLEFYLNNTRSNKSAHADI